MSIIDVEELAGEVEALLFAVGGTMSFAELKRTLIRYHQIADDADMKSLGAELRAASTLLIDRYKDAEAEKRGFVLREVGEGLAFRTNTVFAEVVRALKEERPARLSKPALETLAIVAYRQPATKPEIDYIRGVDCGGTLRLLLDRSLIRIVGKKDEPGRPLLYGTTKHFLNFFSLKSLSQLPTLREFHELTEDSQDALDNFDEVNPSLQDLSAGARNLQEEENVSVQALDEAMRELDEKEETAREAFAAQGISVGVPEDDTQNEEAAPEDDTQNEEAEDQVVENIASEDADVDSE